MRRAGNESQLQRAEDHGWCGPLITRLDPPFRSVIGGGGPAGPLCPVGSAPTLLSHPHLNLAAGGGKMTRVGVSTKLGRTQGLRHLVPKGRVLPKLAANQPSSHGPPFEGDGVVRKQVGNVS